MLLLPMCCNCTWVVVVVSINCWSSVGLVGSGGFLCGYGEGEVGYVRKIYLR
jgi:hypothetical protein